MTGLHAVRAARVEKVRGILDADDDDDDDDAEDDNEDAMVSNVGGSSVEAAATTVADVTWGIIQVKINILLNQL